MNSRRALLEELFRRLDARRVPYCAQRNHTTLFDDASSDVDLLTLPERLADFFACCQVAADATQHRLVQKTRFINHSLMFWNGAAGFVRIDADTEIRWGRHHLLTSAQILQRRQRPGVFDIPDPRDECVIILAQALARRTLSERYAARLRELDRQIKDKNSLVESFAEAFGVRENLLENLSDPGVMPRLLKIVHRRTALQPARAVRSLRYFFADAARWRVRTKSPPGIVLRTVGVSDADLTGLREKLADLFPLQKGLACAGKAGKAGLRKALFKGGLAVEAWPASSRPAPIISQPWPAPGRSFAALREPDGTSHFMHVGSGAMRSATDFAGDLASFICATLAEQLSNQPPARRGAFVVLVGLDGSGKTTLARKIATRVTDEKCFSGTRYFHWLPSLGRKIEFPLPEPGNQPRHQKPGDGILASALSAARLVKNLLRTRLAFWLRVRPLLRRGYLVLADRYFYNYHLDPASVKFSAPSRILELGRKFFPRPDAVVVLRVPVETLLRRKQELSEAEIVRQSAALENLRFGTTRVISADGSRPADELAGHALADILRIAS